MHNIRFRDFLAVALNPFILIPAIILGVNGPITPEMLLDLKGVSQATLDPSGRHVAYVLSVPRSAEEEPGQKYSEIWVAPLKGGEPRPFTSRPVNSWAPRWSPDGEHISFLSKRNDHDESTQIYSIPVDGGEARILTHHETDVTSYRWSPNGEWIAFAAIDAESEEETEAKQAGKDWIVMHKNERIQRLWIYNIESRQERQLKSKDLYVRSYRWTPDSKSIIFQATEDPGADPSLMFRNIYRIPVRGGRPELVCETEGKLGDMAVSPDGEQLAFLGAVSLNDPLPQSLFVVPTAGDEQINLMEGLEESAVHVDWVDNEAVFILAVGGTGTTLSTVNIKNGYRNYWDSSGYIIRTFHLNREKGILVVIASSSQHPSELFRGSLEGGSLVRLTHHNPKPESIRLARQEVIEWTSPMVCELKAY